MMRKNLKRIFALVLLCVFMAAAPFVIFANLPESDIFVEGAKFEGILDLWHIESFEGGTGSRSEWLKRRSISFEKQYKGCLVSVTTLTTEQAKYKLEQGQRFDLVSFSPGVGFDLLPYLLPFEGEVGGVRADLLAGGRVDGKVYGVPYLMGGYVLAAQVKNLDRFENKDLAENIFGYAFEKKVGKKTVSLYSAACGYGTFNQPTLALALNTSATSANALIGEGLTQYEAYERFLTGNHHTVLLGTQRDVVRLNNRISQGRLGGCVFRPLGGFTDLVQYVAVGSADSGKTFFAKKFVVFLTSEAVQQKLAELNMFSTACVPLYSEGAMCELEKALESVRTINVFSDPALLSQLRNEALKALEGGGKDTIKNYLC